MTNSENFRNLAALSASVRPADLGRLFSYAVSNRLYRTIGWKLARELTVEFQFGTFRINPDCGDLGTIGEIFAQKPYQAFSDFIPADGDTCLDVGANIGCVALQWRRSNPTGPLIAVEPHPVTFARMQRNFALNRVKAIDCFHAAIGDANGEIEMVVDEGQNSMARVVGGHLRHLKPFEHSSVVKVQCLTIDTLAAERGIGHLDLLKIDVEGYEVECLRGAAATLPHTARVVLEFHSETLRTSCRALLTAHGFNFEERGSLLFARNRGLLAGGQRAQRTCAAGIAE